MGRNHLSKLARRILAVGIVSCFPGCGSFELASPKPHLGWSKEGLKEHITPGKEADVQIALGRSAENQGDIGFAEVAYRQALKRDKKRGDAHLHLANIQTLKGEYRQAEEEYQKALEITPGNADVFCDMGYSFYLQRKWEDGRNGISSKRSPSTRTTLVPTTISPWFMHTWSEPGRLWLSFRGRAVPPPTPTSILLSAYLSTSAGSPPVKNIAVRWLRSRVPTFSRPAYARSIV